ncbi:MAG: ABC transporter ATP-binding protein [Bacteroidota bacterium]
MSLLHIHTLSKQFEGESVLSNLEFELAEGEMLSILGRSGSGKTTLMKIIAGLETADAGEVWLDGNNINSVPPHKRNIVYLYQEALLFPHLNVFDNVAFGLRLRKEPEATVSQQTAEMLEAIELADQAEKMPQQLSGGQRQRVAFGRALAINPRVLLLDEPFGALDTETRALMQGFLKKVVKEFRITSLFVTHDLKEALLMGDRIGLMQAGKLNVYASKSDFIDDKQTGVQSELSFWENLRSKT